MAPILILNNEPGMLEFIQGCLDLEGYESLQTTKSHEALVLLRNNPIDLFIMDNERPDISGIEFYKILKADEKLRHIPVLFTTATAWNQLNSIHEDIRTFEDGYLYVPFVHDVFLKGVKELLSKHHKPLPLSKSSN